MILKMEYFYEKKLKQHVHREFYYEDFTSDISTTLQYICEDLDVPFQGVPESELKVHVYRVAGVKHATHVNL